MNNAQPDKQHALNHAMHLCSLKEQCISDIQQKLHRFQLTNKEFESIIFKLTSEKFIDEERYAQSFVQDKTFINKWGRVKTAHALRAKGIPESITESSLCSINIEAYQQVLAGLIEHKKLKH
ncbi:MAG: RecX family transcriptional regulator [Bacteroidales bacterium]|nr:RecX family transcriptional regulator [Bacteroidales bacterium]